MIMMLDTAGFLRWSVLSAQQCTRELAWPVTGTGAAGADALAGGHLCLRKLGEKADDLADSDTGIGSSAAARQKHRAAAGTPALRVKTCAAKFASTRTKLEGGPPRVLRQCGRAAQSTMLESTWPQG